MPRPRRRDEALAFIVDRLVRTGGSPSFQEIGDGLKPPVSKGRATQLVQELIAAGVVEKTPGQQRALRICDPALAREVLLRFAADLGFIVGAGQPYPHVQLPRLPPIRHLPDDQPGTLP